MHKDNKAEDERGTRKRCILARKLTLAFWCRKGSLGCGCPRLEVVGLIAKHTAARLTVLVEMIRESDGHDPV